MERENISVDVIAVHGHGHVVVINGMVFELEPGMFDPAIRKIEWAAGQGAFVGKMAGKYGIRERWLRSAYRPVG